MQRTNTDAVALAAIVLNVQLCIALRRAGVLSQADLDEVFDRAVMDQQAVGGVPNLQAADLIEQMHVSVRRATEGS